MRQVTLDGDPNLLALSARSVLARRRPQAVPDVEVVRPAVSPDVAHLAAYSRVCGFDVTGWLPSSYLHVLVFGLQTALMARSDFPLALPGLVHVANRLELRRAVAVEEVLDLAVHAERLRPHARGQQVDLVSEARVGGELIWCGRSTYLARQSTSDAGERSAHSTSAVDLGQPPHARWRLPGDLGRRYATVSGDHNSIHLNPLAAKAFGFPRTIAHGMWSLARCMSSLAGWAPSASVVEVDFRRPVLLPSTVELRAEPVEGGWDVLLTGRARTGVEPKTHLQGRVRPL